MPWQDQLRSDPLRPGVFADWSGRVAVFSAENDPSQGIGDRARCEKLFGRPVEIVGLGAAGHTAALLDPGAASSRFWNRG